MIFSGSNKAADNFIGTDISQLIGKTIEEAFPKLIKTEIPDLYRKVAKAGEKVTREKICFNMMDLDGCCIDMTIINIGPGEIAVFWEKVKA